MNSIKAEIEKKSIEINGYIEKYLPSEAGQTLVLAQAMNYSLRTGGKRLRPMLVLETCRYFGGDVKDAIPFAVAMEMLHTSSLVHDDLPALDNDEYRRGNLTTHKKFGEDIAILAGDGLINRAFEVCADGLLKAENTDRYAKAFKIFADMTGINGMLGGQALDVYMTGKNLDSEQLMYIHKYKTGALIKCSMMIGAVLAGVDDETLQNIGDAGMNVGLAFQIRDDILDVISTTDKLGKPVHSDEKNQKTTYVTLYGLEESKKYVDELSDKAIRTLDSHPGENKFLRELIISLVDRDK